MRCVASSSRRHLLKRNTTRRKRGSGEWTYIRLSPGPVYKIPMKFQQAVMWHDNNCNRVSLVCTNLCTPYTLKLSSRHSCMFGRASPVQVRHKLECVAIFKTISLGAGCYLCTQRIHIFCGYKRHVRWCHLHSTGTSGCRFICQKKGPGDEATHISVRQYQPPSSGMESQDWLLLALGRRGTTIRC